MSGLISRLEPLFWILFGAGAFMAAMLLPALFLVLAIGFPLGWFGSPVETFERMRFLVANPVGKLLFGLLFSLIFWHSAHHLRHFAFDMGMHRLATPLSLALYGLAALGTLAAFGVVGGL